ncbi:hypothetical protein Syun_031956 [Stephania yunnanensis]|uniref:Uncharacterized protein n=1 Tax=Stephania yunnanensis TaxID=152371 RepID=A0AAP0DWK7_9MAGN
MGPHFHYGGHRLTENDSTLVHIPDDGVPPNAGYAGAQITGARLPRDVEYTRSLRDSHLHGFGCLGITMVMNSYVEVVDRMEAHKRSRDNAMTQARIAREELASAQAAAAKSAEELSRAVKEIKRPGSELDQEKKKSQDLKAGLALKETEMSEKLTLLKISL